jgi:ferritin
MLTKKTHEALNRQINAELYSSYLYLSMSAWFEAENYKGLAHWMRVQSGEETSHAMRIFDYLNDRGAEVKLAQIDAPKLEWKSPLDAFEDALAHEKKISAMIDELFNLAAAEKDGASHDFLEWFVREQVEEEANAQLIVAQMKLAGDNAAALLFLDAELGKRKED